MQETTTSFFETFGTVQVFHLLSSNRSNVQFRFQPTYTFRHTRRITNVDIFRILHTPLHCRWKQFFCEVHTTINRKNLPSPDVLAVFLLFFSFWFIIFQIDSRKKRIAETYDITKGRRFTKERRFVRGRSFKSRWRYKQLEQSRGYGVRVPRPACDLPLDAPPSLPYNYELLSDFETYSTPHAQHVRVLFTVSASIHDSCLFNDFEISRALVGIVEAQNNKLSDLMWQGNWTS